jgi:hypothetical protein
LVARAIERPGEHRFRLLRSNLPHLCPTTGLDQEEQAPPIGANVLNDAVDVGKVVDRVARDERVDL